MIDVREPPRQPLKDNTAWCVQDGGTSYATALASASAALVWSAHPDWTANQVARVLIKTAGTTAEGGEHSNWIGYGVARPRKVLLDHEGDPGAPDVDPLAPAPAPAPVKSPTPSADQTAAAPRRAESRNFPWEWPALGAVVAVSLGLGLGMTVIVKRRRR
ncbi:S8 family serine peptidase [Streptomyces sp. NPDC047718]|uniref:S8 family serine peptidase n=1 Tax=Streptomyces sp. NPDC047718 TaxID=3155479 RepID=UPI00340AF9BA